jgi:heptosyltransferase I
MRRVTLLAFSASKDGLPSQRCRTPCYGAVSAVARPPCESHGAQSRSVRLLIVKTSSMGDVIHALPLAADVVRAGSGTTVDWLVEDGFAAIPAMSRNVSTVHPVALRRWRHAPFAARTRGEIATLKQSLRAARYDLVLDAQGLLKSAWVARWAGAPVAGFSSTAARERVASFFYQRRFDIPRSVHAVDRCRALGAAALAYAVEGPPRFDLVCDAKPAVVAHAPYAVLLANASRPTKLWPAERWIEVERALAARGLLSVLFWGSEEEGQRTQALAAKLTRAIVAPRSSLDEIAATLAGARVVVGLDTGLSHLAAALGRPTVAIYCDYDPGLVGLVGDGPVASLGGANVQTLPAQVIEAIGRVMAEAA